MRTGSAEEIEPNRNSCQEDSSLDHCQDFCRILLLPKTLLADIRDGPDEEMEPSRDSCQKDSCRECDRDFDSC